MTNFIDNFQSDFPESWWRPRLWNRNTASTILALVSAFIRKWKQNWNVSFTLKYSRLISSWKIAQLYQYIAAAISCQWRASMYNLSEKRIMSHIKMNIYSGNMLHLRVLVWKLKFYVLRYMETNGCIYLKSCIIWAQYNRCPYSRLCKCCLTFSSNK